LTKEVLEEVTEAAPTFAKVEIPHIEMAEVGPIIPAACTSPWLEGAMAKLVIFLPEFGRAEDMIGFRDLLETALGIFVPWVQVGMMLASQSTVGLFDLFVCGRALDPKYFIIIPLCR
jgi:hypothetical protein